MLTDEDTGGKFENGVGGSAKEAGEDANEGIVAAEGEDIEAEETESIGDGGTDV